MNAAPDRIDSSLYDVEVEQAVLGAARIDNAMLDQASGICEAADFSDPLHQRLFAAMHALRANGSNATPHTLKAAMNGDDGFAEVGGGDYLKSIARLGLPIAEIADLAGIIRDLALRRDADVALSLARERLRSPGIGVFEALGDVMAVTDRAAEVDAQRKGVSNTGIAAMQAVERGDQVRMGKRSMGAPTGIRELDAAIGGLQGPDLIIVAGNSRMGKSALAGEMALACGLEGYQVEIFSLEMSAQQFSIRMACALDYRTRGHAFPLSYSRIIKGKASESEIERAMTAAAKLQALPIRIHDRDAMSFHEIVAISRAAAAKNPAPGVVFIDHLQIIDASDRYRGNRVQEVTEITRRTKGLAKRLGWPVVLLSQLNRDNSKRPDPRPTLSDLRESGSIEQDADIVLTAYRPAVEVEKKRPAAREKDPGWQAWLTDYREVEHKFEIGVRKNRMGEETNILCYCDMRASVITNNDDGGATTEEQENAAGLLV